MKNLNQDHNKNYFLQNVVMVKQKNKKNGVE